MVLDPLIKVLFLLYYFTFCESSKNANIKSWSTTIAKKTGFEWSEYLGRKQYKLNCSPFFEKNEKAISRYNYSGRIILDKEPPLSMKCDDVERRITRLSSNSEVENPLAVARNVYEDYYLQEILLAQSYSPLNAYCYAFDIKSSGEFKTLMIQMASCLPNVIILKETFKFDSEGHFQNHAHYACMKQLISFPKWKYIILLQNADAFIKSPQEISKILEIANGAPLFHSQSIIQYRYRVPQMNITAKSMGLFLNETGKTKEQLETVFTYLKSPVQMLLPRNFVEEIVLSLNLTKLLDVFNNVRVYGTDEYLFATLVSAHFLKLPGQLENTCKTDKVIRYVQWNFGEQLHCKGPMRRHGVCLLGVEYLQTLRDSPLIIANKVWPEFDFGAIMCIESLFHENNTAKRDWKKVTSFYNEFSHVREWKQRKEKSFNISTFKC